MAFWLFVNRNGILFNTLFCETFYIYIYEYTKKEVFEIQQKPLIMYSRYYWIIVDAINSTNEFLFL